MYELNVNTTAMWDTEHFYELMDDKRIFSTVDSKKIREQLNEIGALPALSNHYDWATLCMSYALIKNHGQNLEKLKATPNTKGYEISSFKTCFQKQSHLWLAILSEQLFQLYPDKKITKDDLYQYITQLWHVGASELWALWERCKEFKQGSDLEARKAFAQELVDLAHKNLQLAKPINPDSTSTSELTNPSVFDDFKQDSKLKEAFDSLSIPVKSIDYLSKGLRYDCYQVQLTKYQDLIKKHDEICSALGRNETSVMIEPADGVSFGYKIKILRPQHEWLERNQQDLEQALRQYQPNDFKLPICIGIDEQGHAIFKDLFDAPHLFITGATKSGKSACMRGLLQSLFTLNDDGTKIEVAILDKARVDYVCFENEQNLMPNQPIKDTDKMLEFLNECLVEMDHRLEQMENLGITNWADFRKTNPKPYRIIVIDELAGLVKVNKEVSKVLERLTAEARKTGFHLILSTQTANSENFSQTLRLNVPSRLAMKVDTADQSRTALDVAGAEKLLGKGDHLIKWVGEPIIFAHSYNL
ncbi:hypothetical protein LU290_08995 [Moraxella nasibovis]|uniref:FtsK/SpoIIIE domain-containing protein n=1 Tax=Moraxella nasibovis TaxID=2904120 RepID=UPI00240FA05E|nr:FtsK/SpoIIIE domain-containing protein [Moraxella nasibovis]WFF38373.1 hypothetical protein LU290_08995 [Moraxella nasibovis]